MKKMAFFAALVLTLVSCGNKSTKKLLPSVSGKAGEILVVMDKTPWEGEPGNAVRELLACDCPYLATREPLYSLVNVVPSNFVNLFQVHRNLVIYEIDPQVQKEGVQYLSDIWASPQCVIKVSATTDFVWVADEKTYVYQDIFVYKYPAKGDGSDFELETIIANRNRVLQQNVPGMLDNTYMTTGEFIPPTLRFVKYKSFNFAQVRGYWEVYNDFMGGPFVSHSFYSPDGKEIVVAEAFVYAPRYDKRQYLRQVESLLYSFEWKGTGE